jgi:hypothetical protein
MELDLRFVSPRGWDTISELHVHFRSLRNKCGLRCAFFDERFKLFTVHEHGSWSMISWSSSPSPD